MPMGVETRARRSAITRSLLGSIGLLLASCAGPDASDQPEATLHPLEQAPAAANTNETATATGTETATGTATPGPAFTPPTAPAVPSPTSATATTGAGPGAALTAPTPPGTSPTAQGPLDPLGDAYRRLLATQGQRSVISNSFTTSDTLADYAAACDAATGVHVPWFNCENGFEVPEGLTQTALTDSFIGTQITGSGRSAYQIVGPGYRVETAKSGGGDIWDAADNFLYSNSGLMSGDGTAEVLVQSLTNTQAFSKAGIMFRASLNANAAHVMMAVTPTSGVMFQSRLTAGASATNTVVGGKATPIWLRIVRAGQSFSGYVTSDRITWTQIGPTITMPATFGPSLYLGLAVSSHTPSTLATGVFQQFTWMTALAFSQGGICDRPNVLNASCDPGSKFQVLAQTPDAAAVAHCRKHDLSAGHYGDIAIIQYNKSNGAVCFYQALGNLDGTNVAAPSQGLSAGFPWKDPATTRGIGCVGCHDSGGFIRSPYLAQTGLLPSYPDGFDNYLKPLRYVGVDYVNDRSWVVNAPQNANDTLTPNCNGCHTLSTNTFGPLSGTSGAYANLATQATQAHKAPHSETSPIWMRPVIFGYPFNGGPYDSQPPPNGPQPWANSTAASFATCASLFASNGFAPDPGHPECTYEQTGSPWQPPYDVNGLASSQIGQPVGSYAVSGTELQVTGGGTGITGTSDGFFWAYTNVGVLGDGTAMAKVTSGLTPSTNAAAAAGLMFRTNNAANSTNIFLGITPGSTTGAVLSARLTDGGPTVSYSLPNKSLPIWLRLVRIGNTFTGSVTTDLVTWTQVGPPITISNPLFDVMPNLGVAVTSHNTSTTTTATVNYASWSPANLNNYADANIGTTVGSHTEKKTTETISSQGGDIYGTSDQFHYTFKSPYGDGTAITRVTSQVNTDPFAKAGLMFRDTGDANATNAMVSITPSGPNFQSRSTTGGATTAVNVSGSTLPMWLRLIRSGNTLVGAVSTNGTSWTQVGSPVTLSSLSLSPLWGLAVSSHTTSTTSTAVFENPDYPGSSDALSGFSWIPSSFDTLVDANIGITGGTHTSNAGTETITAAGTDIYGTADQFFYAFKTVAGNATITARVTGLNPTDVYSKAGLMFRADASPGAANAMVAMTPNQGAKGADFQYRPTAGATTTSSFTTGKSIPMYLKLVRAGSVFTGYVSTDGVNWGAAIGSATVAGIGSSALVGLAVTSHNASASTTATFTNVTLPF